MKTLFIYFLLPQEIYRLSFLFLFFPSAALSHAHTNTHSLSHTLSLNLTRSLSLTHALWLSHTQSLFFYVAPSHSHTQTHTHTLSLSLTTYPGDALLTSLHVAKQVGICSTDRRTLTLVGKEEGEISTIKLVSGYGGKSSGSQRKFLLLFQL